MSRRYFDTDYWNGKYVRSLGMTENYLYTYLLLNPETNIAGIFDDQPDLFSFRTKIPIQEVDRILEKFVLDGKIIRTDDKIAMTKHGKHQTKSPDVAYGIARVLAGLSREGLDTLMTPSPHGPYTLPPGCTWKKMQMMIKEYQEADIEKNEGEGHNTLPTPSHDPHTPNLTLPNLTIPHENDADASGDEIEMRAAWKDYTGTTLRNKVAENLRDWRYLVETVGSELPGYLEAIKAIRSDKYQSRKLQASLSNYVGLRNNLEQVEAYLVGNKSVKRPRS